MARIAIIVGVIILIVIGIGVFFGVRAVQERKAERDGAGEEVISTSTQTKSGWKGFFGIVRKDFISKEPFQRDDSTIQMRWQDNGQNLSGNFRVDPLEEDGAGFVFRRGDAGASSNVSGGAAGKQASPSPAPSQMPYGFTKERISPFFGRISIASLQQPRRSDYDRTSISLMADTGISQPINITGWNIRTRSGEVFIPQAIERYVPGSSVAGDVMLGPGHVFFLFGHYRFSDYQHPFGKNIRLNRCTGYLNNLYPFNPKLPERCPKVRREDLVNLSGSCQDFFLGLGTCRIPTSQEANDVFAGDRACEAFAKDIFGYGFCYASYKNSENFFSNEWYAWLSPQGQIPLARDHDRVLLFDSRGLLVDEFSY